MPSLADIFKDIASPGDLVAAACGTVAGILVELHFPLGGQGSIQGALAALALKKSYDIGTERRRILKRLRYLFRQIEQDTSLAEARRKPWLATLARTIESLAKKAIENKKAAEVHDQISDHYLRNLGSEDKR
jgi:hypothetical protein